MMARTKDVLEAAANEIREASGVRVTAVAGDVTTEAGRAALLAACPAPDILVNNAGGPPPGDFREWDRDTWVRALDANMITPILLIKATVDGMIARRFGRIVNITSSAVKHPIDILGLSNGARAGLTGFVAGLARKTVAHNVTINNLLPGPFDTDRLRSTMFVYLPHRSEEALTEHLRLIELLESGTKEEVESYARWHKLRTVEAYRAIHQANDKAMATRPSRPGTARAKSEPAAASS